MRAKFDFVTNSSSSSYILALDSDNLHLLYRSINKLQDDNPDSNEGIGARDELKTLQELQDYVNDEPFDWVSQCRGLQYEMMSKSNYEKCKEAIERDKAAIIIVFVDHDMTEDFELEISDYATIMDSDG
jgi:hypothetical protein